MASNAHHRVLHRLVQHRKQLRHEAGREPSHVVAGQVEAQRLRTIIHRQHHHVARSADHGREIAVEKHLEPASVVRLHRSQLPRGSEAAWTIHGDSQPDPEPLGDCAKLRHSDSMAAHRALEKKRNRSASQLVVCSNPYVGTCTAPAGGRNEGMCVFFQE